MKKLLIIFLLFPSIVLAAEATLTWTAPTQNEDGTPLTDLAGYKIYGGTVQGGPYADVSIDIANPNTTTFVVTGLAADTTYYFVATAYNTAGTESRFSNEASKTTAPIIPLPPENLTVEPDSPTVYVPIHQVDKFVLIAIGTIPPGTECIPDQSVNGHNAVPRDQVIWAGNPDDHTVEPVAVVAKCS